MYGKIFGWRFLSPVHHAIVNLSLHALGYGNLYFNGSGEKWFVTEVLSKSHPKIIIDVGANIGDYSKLLLENTDSRIYAIEPNPHAFKKLSELPERVTKISCAVADKASEAELHFNSTLDEQASLAPIKATGEKVKVRVKTLSDIAKEYSLNNIDFIKIDTEGYEKEVLSGFGDIRPKYIQFEFNINHLHRNTTLLMLTEIIPDYDFYRLLPNGWVKINSKKYLSNVFMFCNIVAVRKE